MSSSSLANLTPTNVALGVLATGALGSVVYSALASGSLATGAASAVSAIRRNDLVVAASDILGIGEQFLAIKILNTALLDNKISKRF